MKNAQTCIHIRGLYSELVFDDRHDLLVETNETRHRRVFDSEVLTMSECKSDNFDKPGMLACLHDIKHIL